MTLNDQLLAAHTKGNTSALIDLYTQAADQSADEDARYFFLTQAYIFALTSNTTKAEPLAQKLKAAQRL